MFAILLRITLKIFAASIVVSIFLCVLVYFVFVRDGSYKILGCPNYGVLEAKSSPDGKWVAEVGASGCSFSADMYVTLRTSAENYDLSPSNRIVQIDQMIYPVLKIEWQGDHKLKISIPKEEAYSDAPKVWRGIDLSYVRFSPSRADKAKHLVIDHGLSWYAPTATRTR